MERGRGDFCCGPSLIVLVTQDASFLGQFDAVVFQTRDRRTDVALGDLAVDVGGAHVRGVVREQRVVTRGGAIRDVGEDRVLDELAGAIGHLVLDGRDGLFGVGDLIVELVQLDLGLVVALAQEFDPGVDVLDLVVEGRCLAIPEAPAGRGKTATVLEHTATTAKADAIHRNR